MLDGKFRGGVDKSTSPIGTILARAGVTADALTVSGIVFSLLAAVFIVKGYLLYAFIAVVLGSLPDLFDGPVAKALGTTSKRGAFFDSFADRISDFLLFGGLAWLYIDRSNHLLAIASLGIYGFASFISYQRAKAESLGFSAKGGLFERAERLVLLALGLLLNFALGYFVIIILVGSAFTALQRFVKVWKQASSQIEPVVREPTQKTPIRRSSRTSRNSHHRRRSSERIRVGFYSTRGGRATSRSTQSLIRKFRDNSHS